MSSPLLVYTAPDGSKYEAYDSKAVDIILTRLLPNPPYPYYIPYTYPTHTEFEITNHEGIEPPLGICSPTFVDNGVMRHDI